MSVRHILGDGVFELTNSIPYETPLTDVQMLLYPNLPGFTLLFYITALESGIDSPRFSGESFLMYSQKDISRR